MSNQLFTRNSDGAKVENPIMRGCTIEQNDQGHFIHGGSAKYKYDGPTYPTATEAVNKTPFLSRSVRNALRAELEKQGLPTTLDAAPTQPKAKKAKAA